MKVSVAPEDHLMTKAFRASNPDGTALETRSGLNGCPEGRRRLQGGYRTAKRINDCRSKRGEQRAIRGEERSVKYENISNVSLLCRCFRWLAFVVCGDVIVSR